MMVGSIRDEARKQAVRELMPWICVFHSGPVAGEDAGCQAAVDFLSFALIKNRDTGLSTHAWARMDVHDLDRVSVILDQSVATRMLSLQKARSTHVRFRFPRKKAQGTRHMENAGLRSRDTKVVDFQCPGDKACRVWYCIFFSHNTVERMAAHRTHQLTGGARVFRVRCSLPLAPPFLEARAEPCVQRFRRCGFMTRFGGMSILSRDCLHLMKVSFNHGLSRKHRHLLRSSQALRCCHSPRSEMISIKRRMII